MHAKWVNHRNRWDFQFRCLLCYMYGVSKSKTFGEGAGCLSSSSGAFFLRWDGSYATYCTLLSNILASLGVNIDWEKLSLAQMRKLSLSMQ